MSEETRCHHTFELDTVIPRGLIRYAHLEGFDALSSRYALDGSPWEAEISSVGFISFSPRYGIASVLRRLSTTKPTG